MASFFFNFFAGVRKELHDGRRMFKLDDLPKYRLFLAAGPLDLNKKVSFGHNSIRRYVSKPYAHTTPLITCKTPCPVNFVQGTSGLKGCPMSIPISDASKQENATSSNNTGLGFKTLESPVKYKAFFKEDDMPMEGHYKYDPDAKRVDIQLRLDRNRLTSRNDVSDDDELYVASILGDLHFVCDTEPRPRPPNASESWYKPSGWKVRLI